MFLSESYLTSFADSRILKPCTVFHGDKSSILLHISLTEWATRVRLV